MVSLANIEFKGLKKEDILNEEQGYFLLITVNAEIIVAINEDEQFRQISLNSICTLDGQVPYLCARIKNKKQNFEKISGSEFIHDIFDYCKTNNKKVFVLGGIEEVNSLAVAKVKEQYDINIEGYSPPFSQYPFSDETNNEIKNKIKTFRPDVLAICFNAKKTNYWAYDNEDFLRELGVKFSIGIGGTVDMLSGRLPRAPKWIQKFCLEGLYRLIKEPQFFRLKRIYTSFKMFKYL